MGLYLPFDKIKKKDYFNVKLSRKILETQLKKQAKQKVKKIIFLDHHTCHAYYSYFSSKIRKDKSCIVSIDAFGDEANQTVWIVDKNKLSLVAKTDQFEIARIYRFITLILKMKPRHWTSFGLVAKERRPYRAPKGFVTTITRTYHRN